MCEKERRKILTCCSTYSCIACSCIAWLVFVCALTGGQTHNPNPVGSMFQRAELPGQAWESIHKCYCSIKKQTNKKHTYIPSSLTTPTHSLELSLLETQPILANVIRCPVSFVYLWLNDGGQYHYQHYQEEQCKGASGQRKCCPLCF